MRQEALQSVVMNREARLHLVNKYRVLIIFIALCAAASMLSDAFLTVNNLLNVARQVSITAIIAAGMTLVILIAGIDLSVGSVMAFSGAIAAGMLTAQWPLGVALIAALLVGLGFGIINGLFVTRWGIPSFITTLAVMVIARGMTLVYTQGYPLVVSHESFRYIGNGKMLGIPLPILIMLFLYASLYWVLRNTSFGRYVYAIGGNEEASRLSGIPVNTIKVAVFGICGLLSALSAIVYTSRLMSAQPTAGTGIELDAIAAVIIGGTSLAGGKGGIAGTLIGALIMGILDNVLNLMNVSPFYQSIVKGLVILAAVLADRTFAKLKIA
ncbi:ribose ABC transporter permease [Brevibacillus thermoruber]|uniref:Ribose ABC transporter permease n=2 Tax=Brevibacillus thermoruber TaxID=33942 RepID=A0A9X3TP37_9BACL|nr:ribose ABC transporter permease [Brevibacillus thermoruber]MDA5107923.1 ribose ABC transporter permease [Brevibacillus thermoruber]